MGPRRRSALGLVIAGSLTLVPLRADADTNTAAAETLFEEGTRLLQNNQVAEACPKFAESKRLDPGVGVSLYYADCLERLGKLASAWAAFREAAYEAGRKKDARAAVAEDRASQLERRLSRLSITVGPDADTPDYELRLDDAVVGRAAWQTSLPVDPGEHTIEARAPGYRASVQRIASPAEGATLRISLPPLVREAHEAPAPPPNHHAQRIVGLALGAAGLVGVVLGSVFGTIALTTFGSSNDDGHCRPDDHCDPDGARLRNDARSAAAVSTIAFVAGGVLVAAGATVYLTAPHDGAGLAVQAKW